MNKKLIQALAKLAKVQDVEAFTKALSEEDTDFELNLDNLVVRTTDEDAEIKENILKENKTAVWKEATEIQIKNMKKDLGLEFEGKDPNDFVQAYKTKILEEAKIEPNKKLSEMEKSMENLRTQLSDKDSEIEQLQSKYQTTERRTKALSALPDLPETLGLTKEEALALYERSHEVKEDGIYRNGEKLKDNLEKPVSLEESILSFVQEKGWNKVEPSGRGGGAQGGSSGSSNGLPTTMDEYESHLKEKGLHPGSQEANAILVQMKQADVN